MRKKDTELESHVKRYGQLYLIILTAVLLIVPNLARLATQDGLYPDGLSYYNIRITESMTSEGPAFTDRMVVDPRPTITTPYHWLIMLTEDLLGIESMRWIQALIGVASI